MPQPMNVSNFEGRIQNIILLILRLTLFNFQGTPAAARILLVTKSNANTMSKNLHVSKEVLNSTRIGNKILLLSALKAAPWL